LLGKIKLKNMWKEKFNEQLPLLGHRNWILIVDKAYPMQSADGIITINTKKDILDVLKIVLDSIKREKHTRPIIYTDKELTFMDDKLCMGVEKFQKELKHTLSGFNVNSILHDEVFSKLDKASQLFNVLVLKTECLMPYTSIFLELNCGYWPADNENTLRAKMAK